MKEYKLNKSTMIVTGDVKLERTISTDEIFTQEIKDMIYDRLDEIVSTMSNPGDVVELTISIDEVRDIRELSRKDK